MSEKENLLRSEIENDLPVHQTRERHQTRKPQPGRWCLAVLVMIAWFMLTKRILNLQPAVVSHRKLQLERDTDFTLAPRGDVVWFDCGDKERYPDPLQCGRMLAPLNWPKQHQDHRNASIAIIYYPAGAGRTPTDRVLGTILTNPGGPGGSGFEFLARKNAKENNTLLASKFDTVFQERYNIVSFDPRGVGRTFPRIDCWNNTHNSYIGRIETDAMGILYSHPGAKDAEIGSRLASNQLKTDLCHSNLQVSEMSTFVGTTAVARDMRLLSRFFGDKKLNYWGFSYGTVLGSVFADMFPEDVNRLAIDGVVDVPNYMRGEWSSNLKDTDADFAGFFEECVKAGPTACSLASQASSANKLQAKFLDLLEDLKLHPIPVVDANVPQLLTFTKLFEEVFQILYKPALWPDFADQVNQIMNGNATAFVNAYGDPAYRRPIVPESSEAQAAIACGDAIRDASDTPWDIHQAKKHLKILESDSKLFGQLFAVEGLQCLGSWRTRSTERHFGNFTSSTSFPILMLGNDYDPVTPGRFADQMARSFGSAVSVRRAGYGHCTLSQPSRCINKVISDYFVHGLVPAKHTKCDVDGSPFPSPGRKGVSEMTSTEDKVAQAFAQIHEALVDLHFHLH